MKKIVLLALIVCSMLVFITGCDDKFDELDDATIKERHHNHEPSLEVAEDWEIVCLGDSESTHGSISGFGNVWFSAIKGESEEIEEYVFYYRTKDGGFHKKAILAKSTIVYEDDNVMPHCQRMHVIAGSAFVEDVVLENDGSKMFPDEYFYKVYVPTGTINKSFEELN